MSFPPQDIAVVYNVQYNIITICLLMHVHQSCQVVMMHMSEMSLKMHENA